MKTITLDTGVLVLLVVGATKPNLIHSHKTTRLYPSDSYTWLCEILAGYDEHIITLGILQEASEILSANGRFAYHTLQALDQIVDEDNVLSLTRFFEGRIGIDQVAREGCSLQVDVVDASALLLVSSGIPIITCNTRLYLEASRRCNGCIDFSKHVLDIALAG